jgi:predicted AAA+ superfamily ATPase
MFSGGDIMHLIDWKTYLNMLISLKGTPDIKVITGVRRSGKSKLLVEYFEWIEENVAESNIISIDLTDLKYEALREYHTINDYIEDRYDKKKENIVANELMRRGYEIYVGVLYRKEIDFVAVKR